MINSLIFVESTPLLKLLKNQPLHSYTAIKTAGVSVFVLENNDYLVLCNTPEAFTHGEVLLFFFLTSIPFLNNKLQIVANFTAWIENAKNVYCVSTKPQPLYIQRGATENSETFLRSVTYKSASDFNCRKLESPNLATGIGAAVMSFCVFRERPCGLFIAFVCSAPLDSVTAKPIVELLSRLNVCKESDLKVNVTVPSSNLYM